MKYFNQPPEIPLGRPTGNQPRFIKRWYKGKSLTLAYILALFHWAEKEYNDVKAWAIVNRNKELYLKLKSVNPIYVLGKSDEFKNIIELMDDNIWRSIPDAIKESLNQAYSVYKAV
jgi:hypothetical protein